MPIEKWKLNSLGNYAVSISLLTHPVSFHAEIRSCACAGASALWHAYVRPRRGCLVCTTYRFRGERREKIPIEIAYGAAAAGPCYWQAVFYRYVHRNSSAISPYPFWNSFFRSPTAAIRHSISRYHHPLYLTVVFSFSFFPARFSRQGFMLVLCSNLQFEDFYLTVLFYNMFEYFIIMVAIFNVMYDRY